MTDLTTTSTNATPAPEPFRLYLQAMPRLALISSLIAIALHLYLGPSLRVCIISLIAGSLISGVLLALPHRLLAPGLFWLAWVIIYGNYRTAIPDATALPYPQFILHLLRYLSTLLTLHVLTLLLFTNPTLRRQLNRLWQKLIEVPSRPE